LVEHKRQKDSPNSLEDYIVIYPLKWIGVVVPKQKR